MISSVSRCSRPCSAIRSPRGHECDLALGQLGHQAREALHPLAVEGRQQQLALLQVGRLVEQDHRVAADDRFEDPRPLAGVQDVRGRLEDFLDLLGIPQHHERRLPNDAQREAAAVARGAALHEGVGATPEGERLQRCGHAGTGGQLGLVMAPLLEARIGGYQ